MWPSDSPGGVSCNLNGVKPCGDVTGMMARIGMSIPKCPNFSGWWIMWWCFVGLTWPYRFFTAHHGSFPPPGCRVFVTVGASSRIHLRFLRPERRDQSIFVSLLGLRAHTCHHTHTESHIYLYDHIIYDLIQDNLIDYEMKLTYIICNI